jgi:3-methylfumaryl-CoA hydratase
MDDFSAWVGRSETRQDRLDPARTNVLRAALGEAPDLVAGDPLPPLCHWLYFWEARTPEQTGADGHAKRGAFLPPVPLPRRMWAGGRLLFRAPLRLGDPVERTSTIRSIEHKSGRSGALTFVTVVHRVEGPEGLAIEEEQDLVYREPDGAPALAQDDVPVEAPAETVEPDPVLLFRYSALTMNSHRIHYDAPYAVGEEGYPGLVVQGPLQATLLARLAARRLGRPLASFRFRGTAAAIVGRRLDLHAEPAVPGLDLFASQSGRRTMVASATPTSP